jgi:hypothetical protein
VLGLRERRNSSAGLFDNTGRLRPDWNDPGASGWRGKSPGQVKREMQTYNLGRTQGGRRPIDPEATSVVLRRFNELRAKSGKRELPEEDLLQILDSIESGYSLETTQMKMPGYLRDMARPSQGYLEGPLGSKELGQGQTWLRGMSTGYGAFAGEHRWCACITVLRSTLTAVRTQVPTSASQHFLAGSEAHALDSSDDNCVSWSSVRFLKTCSITLNCWPHTTTVLNLLVCCPVAT